MSVENVISETEQGIPVMAHAYGKPYNCSDPNDVGIGSAIAAFMIAMGEYSCGLHWKSLLIVGCTVDKLIEMAGRPGWIFSLVSQY